MVKGNAECCVIVLDCLQSFEHVSDERRSNAGDGEKFSAVRG